MKGNSTEWMNAYLSGSLSDEDKKQFENKLSIDPGLASEWDTFRVEQYLDRAMPQDVADIFEQQLQQQPALAEELQFQQEVRNAVVLNEQGRLKKEVRDILPRNGAARRRLRPGWLIAAAAVLLVLVVYVNRDVFVNQTGVSDLYALNFEPYDMLLTERSAEAGPDLAAAIAAYNDRDWETAEEKFATLASTGANPLYALYAGISAMEVGNTDRALQFFGQINSFASLSEQAEWYSALAQLKAGNAATARELLERIAGSDSFYAARARRMIR